MTAFARKDTESPVSCQEAVKNTPDSFRVIITPNDIKQLRLELSESLSQFGLTLKRAIEPKAKRGYSRQYISRLEHGKDVITEQIQHAVLKIGSTFDGVDTSLAGAVWVNVLAQQTVPEGVLIPKDAKVIKCANPGCPVWFIKIHPRQVYHDARCRPKNGHRREAAP